MHGPLCASTNLWSLWGGHCTEKHICISKTLHERERDKQERDGERELMDDSVKNVLKYSRMRLLVGA